MLNFKNLLATKFKIKGIEEPTFYMEFHMQRNRTEKLLKFDQHVYLNTVGKVLCVQDWRITNVHEQQGTRIAPGLPNDD